MTTAPFSELLGPLFGSAETSALFTDHARLRGMLDFEAALAQAETKTAVIPASAGRVIATKCRAELFDIADLMRRDGDGFYCFVARKKDIIRRRRENIAGAELDRVVGQHHGVAEAAAIAVPSDLGEDEILVAVVPKTGTVLTASDIARWCAQHLAPIKIPRYVLFVDSLPHTPTHRVAKFTLGNDPTLLARAVDLHRAKDHPAA
jgi:acyl-CoA synthetase (AMP-forming)/AMP-acid ligase II